LIFFILFAFAFALVLALSVLPEVASLAPSQGLMVRARRDWARFSVGTFNPGPASHVLF
jgi:hypothetical protein